ncbi:MAG: PKD domain-containing protein [Candidatus Anammoxibacter sp.]
MKIVDKFAKTVSAGVIVFCQLAFSGITLSQPSLLNSFNAGLGELVAIGFDDITGNVWVYPSFNENIHEFTSAGTFVSTIPLPGNKSNDIDLDFAPEAMNVGGIAIPANTLLVINGEILPVELFGLNKNNGNVLGTVDFPTATQAVGGAYHGARNTFFTVEWVPGIIREVNTSDGLELNSFGIVPDLSPPFDVFFGDVDVRQATGNLFIVSSVQNTIREMTPTGDFIEDFDVGNLGISRMSGIAIDDATGEAWISTTDGMVYRVGDLNSDVMPSTPTPTPKITPTPGPTPTTPPTASFRANPLAGFAPLKVQFADTSSGDVSNWNWNFGDGLISLRRNPAHEYENPGLYNVKLTVIGEDGIDVKEEEAFIEVLEGEGPTAAFFWEPFTGNAPFTVKYFDQSSGDLSKWEWDFGGGEISNDPNPEHIYNIPGTFTVQLTVETVNGNSGTKTWPITVREGVEPSVGFTAEVISKSVVKSAAKSSKVTANAEEETNEFTVQFTDWSSTPGDEIISWEWDFGDGGEKSGMKNPEHTYTGTDADAFDVSLTVENTQSTDSSTKPAFVSRTAEIVPGLVKGKVTESTSGISIGDVRISLKKTGKTLAGDNTNNNGLYFLEAPSGNYTLSTIKKGFSEFTKINVSVSSSDVETINIELEPTEDEGENDICSFSNILEDQSEKSLPSRVNGLDALRHFRDNVLSRTLKGVILVKLYYKHSAEVTDIINSDTDLRARASQALMELVKVMQKAEKGESLAVGDERLSSESDDSKRITGSRWRGFISTVSILDVMKRSIPAGLEDKINGLIDDIAQQGSDELTDAINEARTALYK